jgi:hypothetical protein
MMTMMKIMILLISKSMKMAVMTSNRGNSLCLWRGSLILSCYPTMQGTRIAGVRGSATLRWYLQCTARRKMVRISFSGFILKPN